MGWYRSFFKIIETLKQRGFILYGAGFWGNKTIQLMNKFQLRPVAVCDDDAKKQGTVWNDFIVSSVDEACEKYPESIVIVAAEDYGLDSSRGKMNQKLREMERYTDETGFNIVRYVFLLDMELDLDESKEIRGSEFDLSDVDKLVVLNHMSESGCVYFNNLIDGHSKILNVPLLGHYTQLQMAYEKRLRYLKGKELVIEIMSQVMPFLRVSIDDSQFAAYTRAATDYCLDEFGKPEEKIYVDVQKMYIHLMKAERQITDSKEVTFGQLLKMIFVSYNNAAGRTKEDGVSYWIFYQMHKANYHLEALNQFELEEDFVRVEYLYIVREPVQQTFAWMSRFLLRGDERERHIMCANDEIVMRFRSSMGAMLRKKLEVKFPVHVVRFEDLKMNSRETMERICAYLGIEYEDVLTQTTANGYKVYFPFFYEDGEVIYITGNATNALKKRDVSGAMTTFDEFRLELVYADMKQAYNYFDETVDYIELRKEIREEIFDYDFKFYSIFEQYNKEIESLKEMLQKDFKRKLQEEPGKEYYPLI